jgi:7-carboxy-7-deazaguanine synthase
MPSMLSQEQKYHKRLRSLEGIAPDTLMVHEIFGSIQGESTHAGLPCVFVRLTACNLRCTYCDTRHAFYEGRALTLTEIFQRIQMFGLPLVELTGGEPLLQPNALNLMTMLCDANFQVLLETSGSLDIRPVDPRVKRIVDLKTPGSGEQSANLLSNIEALRPQDEVKFVLCNRHDYEWAKNMITSYQLADRCALLMGAAFGELELFSLADWIVQDKLPVRMQLQLHKYIWDPDRRGV